jgi:CheY-like chemotaxis protein
MTQPETSRPLLDGLSVLVVEDEAIISFLLEDMLEELGAAHIRHASNVQTALRMLDEKQPDLAVLDVNLGGERVYPVAERLDANGIVFIFTTGYGRDGIDPRWHAKHVVQKPFNIDMIKRALDAVLPPR